MPDPPHRPDPPNSAELADTASEVSAAELSASDAEPVPTDPMLAASHALGRARRVARERGFRPGSPASVGGGPDGLRRRRSAEGTRDGRDPHLVGAEMERLLAERGWEGEVQTGSVVGRWNDIVGPQVGSQVIPVAFEGTVLTVRAESTAWATQMRLLVHSVLTRIEAEVGEGVVTEIIVQGPGGPSWRKGPLNVPGRGPRDTYG